MNEINLKDFIKPVITDIASSAGTSIRFRLPVVLPGK